MAEQAGEDRKSRGPGCELRPLKTFLTDAVISDLDQRARELSIPTRSEAVRTAINCWLQKGVQQS